MNIKRLKFPIEVQLTNLVLDFGEWSPQLKEGIDSNGWKLHKIIEIACGIRKEYIETLAKLKDKRKRKIWQKYLVWMTDTIIEANHSLIEEQRHERKFKHRKIC